jgi:hypothetical protein
MKRKIASFDLFESKEGQAGTNMEPSKIIWKTTNPTLLPGPELFSTGMDKINRESPNYKKLVATLKAEAKANAQTPGKIPYKVIGGASGVKLSGSYDNQALAERRAKNMVEALRQDLGSDFDKFNFRQEGVVGVQTQKGPEANKEQFVKLKQNSKLTAPDMTTARDATATPLPDPKKPRKELIPVPVPEEEKVIKEEAQKKGGKICFEIGYTKGGMSLTSDYIHIALDKNLRKFTIKRIKY